MTTRAQNSSFNRLTRLRRQRRVQNFATLGLVVLGPILTLATYLVLGPLDQGASAPGLRFVLLADLVYVLAIATLVLQRVARMVAARRAKSAGSRLHLRLTGAFALMSLIPTITVAVFAALTVNIGLEGWFSDRVRQVVGTSLSAAEAYESEQIEGLRQDAIALARLIDETKRVIGFLEEANIREVLTQGQAQIQRGLREAYVIDSSGAIRSRGDRSYLFDFEQPTSAEIASARADGIVIIEDWDNFEFRALVPLDTFVDRFVYVSRAADGDLLKLLDDTQETALLYQQLESERGKVLFEFGLLYLGFALILILAAVWLGMWFAERLARPVGRLTGAAQRIGAGDLDLQVVEEDGDDEIAMLGRYFNQMTRQLKGQRDALLENTAQIDRRRRLFDSVLSSITSGVVGLDPEGQVTFVNQAARRLLDWSEDQHDTYQADRKFMALKVAVPEFGEMFESLRTGSARIAQGEIKVSRAGRLENLLVRMATRRNVDGIREGYVVTFEDVTDLVAAQRMAAWGDVARRIAHEIKNPLTPIQLSAERINRKFRKHLDDDLASNLEQYTDVIVRQTNDLRRIVDEFSKFARMPEPECREISLNKLLRDVVFLQENGLPDVRLVSDFSPEDLIGDFDATMINQALINLIKNAAEATESYKEKHGPDGFTPEVHISSSTAHEQAVITISDNGIGLPEDRARLFEPYVTSRAAGTGLGLPIVKKIIEEHGGTLSLEDADVFAGNTHFGAMAVIHLPIKVQHSTDEETPTSQPFDKTKKQTV